VLKGCTGAGTGHIAAPCSKSMTQSINQSINQNTFSKALSTLSQKSATVAENGDWDSRRIRRQSHFLRQSPFSVTVWTGLYGALKPVHTGDYSRRFRRQCGQALSRRRIRSNEMHTGRDYVDCWDLTLFTSTV